MCICSPNLSSFTLTYTYTYMYMYSSSHAFSDDPMDVVHTVPYSSADLEDDTEKKGPPPLSLWMSECCVHTLYICIVHTCIHVHVYVRMHCRPSSMILFVCGKMYIYTYLYSLVLQFTQCTCSVIHAHVGSQD